MDHAADTLAAAAADDTPQDARRMFRHGQRVNWHTSAAKGVHGQAGPVPAIVQRCTADRVMVLVPILEPDGSIRYGARWVEPGKLKERTEPSALLREV